MGDGGDAAADGVELGILVAGLCVIVSHTFVECEEGGQNLEESSCAPKLWVHGYPLISLTPCC